MTVGKRIEKAADAVGLTQRALATETGISQPTLSRIISGERAPKVRDGVRSSHRAKRAS